MDSANNSTSQTQKEGNITGILEDGPIRQALRERKVLKRSPTELLFQGILDRIRSAIAEEKEAIDDYAELENKLRAEGFNIDADTVKEIRSDEQDHLIKFQEMLRIEEMQRRA